MPARKPLVYKFTLTVAIVVALISASPAWAQSATMSAAAGAARGAATGAEPSWLSFERGKRLYASKDFGNALLAFDSAIEFRRVVFAEAKGRLLSVLDTKTAKKSNGTLSGLLSDFALEDFLVNDYRKMVKASNGLLRPLIKIIKAERISEPHRAFLDVMELVLEYRSLESLADSPSALMEQVDELSLYPEAEYWKGRVFLLEGELDIAIHQYLRAFGMRASLEIPEEKYVILYSLADIYATSRDFLAWENTMKRILKDDAIAGDPAYESGPGLELDRAAPKIDTFLRDAMMSTLQANGIDKFMTLYRLNPSFSLQANAEMATYYLERGRAQAPLHAAVAVNMVLSKAIGAYSAWDRDYAWAGLSDFLGRAKKRESVDAYLRDAKLYPLLLTLADALYLANGRQSALEIWKIVAAEAGIPWSAGAKGRLANPEGAVRRNPVGPRS